MYKIGENRKIRNFIERDLSFRRKTFILNSKNLLFGFFDKAITKLK